MAERLEAKPRVNQAQRPVVDSLLFTVKGL
jgi:hypothetical protein